MSWQHAHKKSDRAWQGQQRPIVLGHRGASALELENTLAAFSSALASGADGFELDVRLTSTGELVVFHDETLERIFGDLRRVDEVSWQQLSELRAKGQGIALLSTVLQEFPRALVNIELKPHPLRLALPLVRATLGAILESQACSRVLVSSFDPRLLAAMRLFYPDIPRGLLSAQEQGRILRHAWLAPTLDLVSLHPEDVLVSSSLVAKAHAQGLLVNTWTVDDPLRIRQLLAVGVDGIISNDPAATLNVISELESE